MATYAIGDIQGCLHSLKKLLDAIRYDPSADRLLLCGDLINRGPHSLETLRFLYSLENTQIVLGNHDLHLIALYYGAISRKKNHCLQSIIHAPDCDQLIAWLLKQPLLHHDLQHNSLLVHAGIPPQWSITQAINYGTLVKDALLKNPKQFLTDMYGDTPCRWSEQLAGADLFRYIINALTRMRFCQQDGTLNLKNNGTIATCAKDKPWFEWYQEDTTVLFGHWASLKGVSSNPKCIALDSGCVWGYQLTAYHIESKKKISVPSQDTVKST